MKDLLKQYLISIERYEDKPTSQIDASIIIVNYNGGDLFVNLVEKLFKIVDICAELIIIDNGSNDNSLQKVLNIINNKLKSSYIKRVTIARLARNLGPCIGYNLGVLLSSSNTIIFMNNDIDLPDNFTFSSLLKVFKRLQKYNIAGITIKIKKLYQQNVIDSAGTLMDRWLYTIEYGMNDFDNDTYNKPYKVYSVPLIFSVMDKKAINEVGLLDWFYFLGYEDLDLSLRLRLMGKELMYIPWFNVYHFRGYTSGKKVSNIARYFFARAYLLNVLTYMNILQAFSAIILRMLVMLFSALKNKDPNDIYLGFLLPLIRVLKSKYYAFKRYHVNEFKILSNKSLNDLKPFRSLIVLKAFLCK